MNFLLNKLKQVKFKIEIEINTLLKDKEIINKPSFIVEELLRFNC